MSPKLFIMGNSQTLHQMRGVTVEDLRQSG
jgi:hypothetical protein